MPQRGIGTDMECYVDGIIIDSMFPGSMVCFNGRITTFAEFAADA